MNTPVAISSTHLQVPEPQVRPISVSDGAAPDLVDLIVGFRQWRLSEGALWSLYSGVRWSTAELRRRAARVDMIRPSHHRRDARAVFTRATTRAL